MKLMKSKVQKQATAGLLIAVGLLLPFVCAHGIGIQGTVFLPMHIPVFLIGLLCGPMYGALCGVVIPVLNSLLTGMPAVYPSLPLMAAELCVYGLVSGLMYHKTKLSHFRLGIYPALIAAMICGRAAYGALFQLLLLANPNMRGLSVISAFITGIPGIAVQIIVVPAIVMALQGTKKRRDRDVLASAGALIREESASCVVMREGQIVKTAYGSGLKPLLELYEAGLLKDALVADKIIGKAASMILVLGGAQEVYGETISRSAMAYLADHGIKASGGRVIDMISNRLGTGICPMERTVMELDDPNVGLAKLRDTMAALRMQAQAQTA